MPTFYGALADTMRNIYDRRIHAPAILEQARYFPQGDSFAADWQAIRDEAAEVARELGAVPRFHELMSAQTPISANDNRDWRVFVLKAYGHAVPQNLARCPATTALVEKFPSVLSASFSFLAPGKHIPPHRGPFRGVLRFHLGLSMPRGEDGKLGAILWVDGEEIRLDDGGTLLWDDTYTHEVRNTTDQVRTCLLLDVWRPQMPMDMVALSHVIVAGARAAAYINSAAF